MAQVRIVRIVRIFVSITGSTLISSMCSLSILRCKERMFEYGCHYEARYAERGY